VKYLVNIEEFLNKVERNKEGDILLDRWIDENGATIEIAVPEENFLSMFGHCFSESNPYKSLIEADDIIDEIDLNESLPKNISESDKLIIKRIKNLFKIWKDEDKIKKKLSNIRTETGEPIKIIERNGNKLKVVYRTRGYKKYFEKWKKKGLL